ncbi:hypothetical protein E1301_Tti021203 [Triplophysa tibetana]|uniref:APOBEC-like N-terminal domain-containing protein n=1 Tax=Triplophysa tibetana TaxID=1572043 RepID=A0A5A9MXF7_9TELE|nr:hypothetical protein E1301_Tti021203 [Triplophysa tibetana]
MFTVSVSGVLLLFLLHHSTLKSVDGQIIDSNTLARVISFFEQNYKIVINKKQELQYAVAINVPTVQCDAGFNLSKNNFLTNENPTDVKRDITNNSYPVYQGKELIAAGVKKICTNNRIHSERLLLNPTVEIPTTPMQNLLNRRDDSCTILYSLNSPCSKACLNVNSPNNILPNIETWTAHNSIKAFVFKHIFRGEGSIDTLRSGLQRIANYKRVDADGHPRQYATAINVPKVQCQAGFNPSQKNFLTQEDAKNVLTVAQRSLVLIVLLHPCILNAQNVNTQTLANIVKAFEAKLGKSGQYAVAFRVGKEKCSDSSYSGQDLKIDDVKTTIENNEVYKSNNLIAAKALKGESTQHSEYRLMNYLKNILNVKDGCVIFFTVNSPCLDRCLAEEGKYTIKSSLTKLQNYKGVKALAFKKVWMHDKVEKLKERLTAIAPDLPCYQCENNKAKCVLLYQVGQYAAAINVPAGQCDHNFQLSATNFLRSDPSENVRNVIMRDKDPVYRGTELIAAGVQQQPHSAHSEYLLLNPVDNSPLTYLLNKKKNACVVFYTLNSPCMNSCLNGRRNNIIRGIDQLKNYQGIKAFVFKNIWTHEQGEARREQLRINLKKIADRVPLYRCRNNACTLCGQPNSNEGIKEECLSV